MWSDLGFNIPITEGFYWLDRGIIRAFSSDGILHRLYKYKVNDDLTINITKHKEYCDFNPESWEETYKRLKNGLQNKICLLYTSPSPRDLSTSRMPSSA